LDSRLLLVGTLLFEAWTLELVVILGLSRRSSSLPLLIVVPIVLDSFIDSRILTSYFQKMNLPPKIFRVIMCLGRRWIQKARKVRRLSLLGRGLLSERSVAKQRRQRQAIVPIDHPSQSLSVSFFCTPFLP